MSDWSAKLSARGIRSEPVGPHHWRAKVGTLMVDYWPTTERWRDIGTGLQGVGFRSMAAHIKRRGSQVCVNHFSRPARTNLDGDDLCQECANAWARAEGRSAAEAEAEDRERLS